MTISYFPLVLSRKSAPQFLPTLDSQQYKCTVTWNLQGQRYYLNCFTLVGVLIFSIAIVESPAGLAIDAMSWDANLTRVTLTASVPHLIPIGMTVRLTVAGCVPDAYNGQFDMLSTGPSTLTYPLAVDPLTPATGLGSASTLISLCAGYFASTLIYRQGRFEVSP